MRDVFSYFEKEDVEMARNSKARMSPEADTGKLVKEGGTFFQEVNRYLTVAKVKRMVALGERVFSAVVPFLEKPTWWNAGKSVFTLGKVFVEDAEIWSDDYFGGDEWVQLHNSEFNQTLLTVLQKFPFERIKTSEEDTHVRVCTLPNGVKVGWSYKGQLQLVDYIYTETNRLHEARECVKQLLWAQFSKNSLLMRRSGSRLLSGEQFIVFELDDTFSSKPSQRATDYAEYLEKPISHGHSRTVMFYGPAGTGKSTLARTIVENLGLRSFRIRIGDLNQIDSHVLIDAINIFEPSAVILDDFDRAHNQAQLLEMLEIFKEKIKLLIVTVNNRQALDNALRRPGRIDETWLVDKMEENVVRDMLGEFDDGFNVVKDWPIAYIQEYVIRRKYMSKDKAASSLLELTQRVEEMDSYDDAENDDFARMIASIAPGRKKKKKRTEDAETNEQEDP